MRSINLIVVHLFRHPLRPQLYGTTTRQQTTCARASRRRLSFYIRKNGDIKMLALERPVRMPEPQRPQHRHLLRRRVEQRRGRPTIPVPIASQKPWRALVLLLLKDYPGSRLCGHRDLSPGLNGNGDRPKEWIWCPCFDAASLLDEPLVNPGYLVIFRNERLIKVKQK